MAATVVAHGHVWLWSLYRHTATRIIALDRQLAFVLYLHPTFICSHSLYHTTGDQIPTDLSSPASVSQLLYLSAGVCLGRRGVHCACKRLCIGAPGPCLLGGNAGVPFGGWAGGISRWEGVWGGRWEAGEQEAPCWD